MAPGPFTITLVYCGRFSTAQQQEFGTNAKGGLIYKYVNESQSLSGSPKLDVNFTSGSTVAGENVSATETTVTPGQSATGEVDAVGSSGSDLSFTGCEILSYSVVTSSGVDPVSYAG